MNSSLYNLWNILAIISGILSIVTMFILLFAKFVKNRFYHEFHEDELIKKTKTANATNKLYFTSGETYRFIKKYVVSETPYDKFVVANYSDLYSKISFYVMCYKNKKTPFKVLEYTEYATLVNGSKLIVIPKETVYVNIVVKQINETMINKNVIMPLSKKRINAYALVSSLHIFTSLFTIRHLIGLFICTVYTFPFYLNSLTNYISVILTFLVGLFSFFIAKNSNQKLNKKNQKEGGVIEYDFA